MIVIRRKPRIIMTWVSNVLFSKHFDAEVDIFEVEESWFPYLKDGFDIIDTSRYDPQNDAKRPCHAKPIDTEYKNTVSISLKSASDEDVKEPELSKINDISILKDN